jgi:hypothetical protein
MAITERKWHSLKREKHPNGTYTGKAIVDATPYDSMELAASASKAAADRDLAQNAAALSRFSYEVGADDELIALGIMDAPAAPAPAKHGAKDGK